MALSRKIPPYGPAQRGRAAEKRRARGRMREAWAGFLSRVRLLDALTPAYARDDRAAAAIDLPGIEECLPRMITRANRQL